MRLTHELMHLRVRGEVHDEVDVRVLDTVDPARERCVVARKVLEQRRELVAHPRVRPLVDAEDLVAVAQEAQREVRADLS